MLTLLKTQGVKFSAALTVGLLTSSSAFAGGTITARADGLKEMTENFLDNTLNLPGLISVVAYMAGLALGVLGILKLKDHVENPSQTPLKDGAVRLGAGGALLALPFLYDVLINNLAGDAGTGTESEVVGLTGLGQGNTVIGP